MGDRLTILSEVEGKLSSVRLPDTIRLPEGETSFPYGASRRLSGFLPAKVF